MVFCAEPAAGDQVPECLRALTLRALTMAADPQLVSWLKEFHTVDEIHALWKIAGQALADGKTEGFLTGTNFEGGTSTMQKTGDPGDYCAACEQAIAELKEENATEPAEGILGNPAVNFSRRIVRT